MTSHTTARNLLATTTAFGLALAGTVFLSGPAAAASLTASTEVELVAAITTANSTPAVDTITLGASFSITNDLPTITEPLEIDGGGFSINGDGYTVFTVDGSLATASSDTTFSELTVADAYRGIVSDASNVTIVNSAFDDAPVQIGGAGISAAVTGSAFENANNDSGLSIFVIDSSAVTVSGVTANSNSDDGIYIVSEASSTTITGSTLNENSGNGLGGEFFAASSFTLSSTTASSNFSNGVNIDADEGSTVEVTNVTALTNEDEGVEISAFDGATAEVSGSTANDNENDGFDFNADEPGSIIAISNSTASGNGSSGFEFDSEAGTVTGTNLTSNDNENDGFDIDAESSGSVTVSNTTATANADAGLSLNAEYSASVTISDSTFEESHDGIGAEIWAQYDAVVTLERVTVEDNADGGIEIYDSGDGNDSAVTVTDSTIANNDGSGFEVFISESTAVTIQGTTISGNSDLVGSGIYAELDEFSSLSLLNSTISGNEHVAAGALSIPSFGSPDATLTIAHSTITDNHAESGGETGGVGIAGVTYSIDHSIIAGNTADGAASDLRFDSNALPTGTVNYSLIQSSTGAALAAVDAGTGNLKNTSAMLGALADNGGLTRTHLPLASSPVIDAGNAAVAGAPATDQRGETRIVNTIDLGAVEIQSATSTDAELLPATGSGLAPLTAITAFLLLFGGLIVALTHRRRTV